MLNEKTVQKATDVISKCDLFISIGTSAVVWPAAGYPKLAKSTGAFCIEIKIEDKDYLIVSQSAILILIRDDIGRVLA